MLGEMFLIADSDIIHVIDAIPQGNSWLQMCKSSSGPFSLDVTLLFSYFHSASSMFRTRHNILVLECDIVDSCVTALSWHESMNLIYYYFSFSPTLCI